MSENRKELNENDPKKTFVKRAEERKARYKKDLEESTVSRSTLVLREFEIHNVSKRSLFNCRVPLLFKK